MTFFRKEPKEPDWTNVEDFKRYLGEIGDPRSYDIDTRMDMTTLRLGQERGAQDSISYFGGDFIVEEWQKQLDSLKTAMDQKVDVRVLARWDSSAGNLQKVIREYVKVGIPIKSYYGPVRGGVYDKKRMYIVERHLAMSPEEIEEKPMRELPKKIVGYRQKDEIVPLRGLFVHSDRASKKFSDFFDREFKNAMDMKTQLEKSEKFLSERKENGTKEINNIPVAL